MSHIIKNTSHLQVNKNLKQYLANPTTTCCCFLRFKAQQCLGQRYGLKALSTTRKPPFLTKFALRLQVQASEFELTTPILEAARSNH